MFLDSIRGWAWKPSGSAANNVRFGNTNELMVSDALPRYYDLNKNGFVYSASNVAAQALSVNSTTATGLILTNPIGSGIDLVLLEIQVALASLPAGQSSLILTGSSVSSGTAVTHTTPLTPRSNMLGSSRTPIGLADSAATITATNIIKIISGGTAATVAASTAFPPFIKDEIAGSIILTPGTCISLQCLTTAISVVASMTWAEVPTA